MITMRECTFSFLISTWQLALDARLDNFYYIELELKFYRNKQNSYLFITGFRRSLRISITIKERFTCICSALNEEINNVQRTKYQLCVQIIFYLIMWREKFSHQNFLPVQLIKISFPSFHVRDMLACGMLVFGFSIFEQMHIRLSFNRNHLFIAFEPFSSLWMFSNVVNENFDLFLVL